MRRLVLVLLGCAALAGCGGGAKDAADVQVEGPASYEADGLPADEPQPMNAPPAEYPNVYDPAGEPAAAAPPGVDRGLPVCPGDPRCKKK